MERPRKVCFEINSKEFKCSDDVYINDNSKISRQCVLILMSQYGI